MVQYYNPETRPLTMSEMTVNAEFILSYLLGKGWTKNAVCGMLGNMQSESSINPARWQSDVIRPSYTSGFGLVQWTPYQNYMNWVAGTQYDYKSMEGNLERILYEVANGLQWITKSSYPISFREFTTSQETPEYLAQAFITNYERPADPSQPARSTQARYWFDNLTGTGVINPSDPGDGDPTNPPTTDPNKDKGKALIHMFLAGTISGWR
jgi:hypothetical protein